MEKAKQNPENCPDQKSKTNHHHGQYPGIIITDFSNHDVSIQGLVISGYEKFEKWESGASTPSTLLVPPGLMVPSDYPPPAQGFKGPPTHHQSRDKRATTATTSCQVLVLPSTRQLCRLDSN